jgi:hypothetical protein
MIFHVFRRLKNVSFKDDFPDIVKQRLEKRKKQVAEAEDRRTRIAALTQRTYARLVTAVSDLVSRRVVVRLAFGKWLEVLQLQSKAMVQPPNYTGLRRSESKYRARDDQAFGSQYKVGR